MAGELFANIVGPFCSSGVVAVGKQYSKLLSPVAGENVRLANALLQLVRDGSEHRVAGNVANTSTIASIEYAVAHLGCNLIVVLGHQSCGAVTAALAGGDNGHNLNHLGAHIVPAIDSCGESDVDSVVKENAKVTSDSLAKRSDIIQSAVKEGLQIMPAFYCLESGKVEFL